MESKKRIGSSKEETEALFRKSYSEHIKNNNEETANSLALLDVLSAYNQRILEDIKELSIPKAHIRL